MEKIVLVVERQSQHDKRIESLEKKTKINDERLTMLEKYKVKILAFGSGVVACLYIFAPDISKAISSGIKQLL